jgi:hypothetical protein
MSAITAIPPTPPRPFFHFCCKQNTYPNPRLGGACMALGLRLGGPWVAQAPPKPNPNRQRVARFCQIPITKSLLRLLTAYCQRSCAVHTLRRSRSIAASFKRIKCESGQWMNNRMDAVSLRSGHGPDMRCVASIFGLRYVPLSRI